jgi:hypothetical protein
MGWAKLRTGPNVHFHLSEQIKMSTNNQQLSMNGYKHVKKHSQTLSHQVQKKHYKTQMEGGSWI